MILKEGGNLILRTKDGEEVERAEKINFNKLSRRKFLKDFRRFFIWLNKMHKKNFGEEIWSKEIFYNGEGFSGSAEFLFDENIPDHEFKEHKPFVGDVDISVPEKHKDTFEKILEKITYTKGEVTKNLTYIGNKRAKNQILFLFYYSQDNHQTTIQVDFEYTDFEDGQPTPFERFIHSSNWADIKKGLKGSLHKILIQSIAKGTSLIENSQILTPKRGNVTTAKRHENAAIFSFSVPEGLRIKYKPEMGNKYRYIPPGEADRVRDVPRIFFFLFKEDPDERELEKFHSFTGTLDLMKNKLDKHQVSEVFRIFMNKIYHREKGMTIDRRYTEDYFPKESAVQLFVDKFPFLSKYNDEVYQMKKIFYNTTSFEETSPGE